MMDGQSGNLPARYRCVEPRLGEQILKYGDDDLDAALREELADHLSICRHCQVLLELDAALREQIDSGVIDGGHRRPAWRAPAALFVAAAAIALFIGLTLFQPNPSISGTPSMGFIANHEQVDGSVRFFTVGSHGSVFFLDDGLIFDLRAMSQDSLLMEEYHYILNLGRAEFRERGSTLHLRFKGVDGEPFPEGRSKLETRHHFFIGNDPSEWHLDKPAFGELVYRELWPGVDLVFRESGGRISYHLEGAGAGAMGKPQFRIEGADSVSVDREGGSTLYHTSIGDFVELSPGDERAEGIFLWSDELQAFHLEESHQADDPSKLLLSTFIGGYEFKAGTCLTQDHEGNIIMGGLIASLGNPGEPGFHDTISTRPTDAFIAKMSSDGRRLLWCAYFGGDGDIEGVTQLLVRDDGGIVALGNTNAEDFPVMAGAFDTSYNSQADELQGYPVMDCFLVTVSSDGGELLYSTFFGGSSRDIAKGLCFDAQGDLYVTGNTLSSNYPRCGEAWGGTHDLPDTLDSDIYVTKIKDDLSALVWSTSFGGSKQDHGMSIALSEGALFIAGASASSDFPTTPGSPQTQFGGGVFDAVLVSLDADTGARRWSSFLGGEGDWDFAYDVAVDDHEQVFVTGGVFSEDFPVTDDAYDRSYNDNVEKGGNDIFLSVVSHDGSELIYSTYLGGGHTDFAQSLVLGESGEVHLVGHSASTDFPVTAAAYDRGHNGGSFDAFYMRFDWLRGEILDASYLGGVGDDWGWSVYLDRSGSPVILGQTSSLNFPTTSGAYDRIPNRTLFDIFVVRLAGDPDI